MGLITEEQFNEVVDCMREHDIPPQKIRTKKEAKVIGKGDPLNRRWRIGDKFYMLCTDMLTIPVKMDS